MRPDNRLLLEALASETILPFNVVEPRQPTVGLLLTSREVKPCDNG